MDWQGQRYFSFDRAKTKEYKKIWFWEEMNVHI